MALLDHRGSARATISCCCAARAARWTPNSASGGRSSSMTNDEDAKCHVCYRARARVHGAGARAASVPDPTADTKKATVADGGGERVSEPPLIAYIALGSNLEGPGVQVARAIAGDRQRCQGHALLKRSSLYRTAPVGLRRPARFRQCSGGGRDRASAPRTARCAARRSNGDHGRVREFPNAPRTLDLDVLLYGDVVLHEPGLTHSASAHARARVRAAAARGDRAGDCDPGHGRVGRLLRGLTHRTQRLGAVRHAALSGHSAISSSRGRSAPARRASRARSRRGAAARRCSRIPRPIRSCRASTRTRARTRCRPSFLSCSSA